MSSVGILWFLIVCFYGFYFAVCVFLVVFLNFCLFSFLFSCLFSKQRKKGHGFNGWEVGSIWEELERGDHDQNILYKKLFQLKQETYMS